MMAETWDSGRQIPSQPSDPHLFIYQVISGRGEDEMEFCGRGVFLVEGSLHAAEGEEPGR